ncbi:hypothetical protein [Stutzerimonas degradans]
MTTNNSFDMSSHMDFGLNELLPLVAGYAHSSGHPPQAALVASFLFISTLLYAKGVSRDEMVACIDSARPTSHDAPEGLQ